MLFHRHMSATSLTIAVLGFFIWAMYGCSMVGPVSISRGRPDYNEAINRTDDQQMLMKLVHNRYGETSSMLAVTNVTANVRVATSAGVNVGFGSSQDFAGNLVPFSGGVEYEENPTISYTPIQGEQYIRQLMSPIPLDLLVLFIRSMVSRGLVFTMMTTSVNDIRNPDFIHASSVEADPRFTRFVELLTDLGDTGHLVWLTDPKYKDRFFVVIRGYAPTHQEQVRELLALLGVPEPADVSGKIVLPVFLAVEGAALGSMAITTRSIYDIMEILAASIDVPAEHLRSGLAFRYPPVDLAGENVSIHLSSQRPQNASVAVKYRENWFYIDETDQSTKLIFGLLQTLWSVRIANASDKYQSAPVLTLPVSR